MPAARATSWVVVAWRPFSTNARRAAERMAPCLASCRPDVNRGIPAPSHNECVSHHDRRHLCTNGPNGPTKLNDHSLWYHAPERPTGKRESGRERVMDVRDRQVEARLDTVGWGVLFVVTGGVLLIPGLPAGSWLIAVGVVLVGVSLARVAARLPVVWTTACVA